jgi:NAD-dependent deacetylase
MTSRLSEALALLRGARRVVALTGAGMSAESGVPTFREAQTGLWAKYDPQELATPEAFRRNPARVFSWYVSRLRAVRQATPHAGYDALVRLARLYPGRFTVVTQNVDGLHSRAGSKDVIELHGSLEAYRCAQCRHPHSSDAVLEVAPGDRETPPPTCSKCGNFIRPDVVWYGEALPGDALERAAQAAQEADAALVIGTSSLVFPAAQLPSMVSAAGGKVIEINPEETPLSSSADVSWRAAAGEALPILVDALAREVQ